MRILAPDGIESVAEKELCEMGHQVVKTAYDPEQLADALSDADVLIVRSATKVRKPVIDAAVKANRLKMILRGGVGMDNIDVDYARSQGIIVENTPTASTNAVAEMAIAHMLSVSRFVGEATHTMRNGQWEKKAFKGTELFGKTLGVIGFGRIGRRTAELAKAFGMEIIAYNRSQCDEGKALGEYVSLEELFSRSDIITMHLPGAPEGIPLVRSETISQMKDGVIIINTGRGNLINEADLISALDSGKVAAAGLDVYVGEPDVNKALVSHPHISCTPHIGASTKEAQVRIAKELVKHIKSIA